MKIVTKIGHVTWVLILIALMPKGYLNAQKNANPKSTTKPNVIVIIVDDLGSGDVSSLFRTVIKTPNIDRFATQGVKFESGYVPVPLCGPSRAGFLTGLYPQRFGFSNNAGGIPTTIPMLPNILKNAGYYTAHIGKWHSDGPMPYLRDAFNETLCSPISSPFINYYNPRLARNGVIENSKEYSTDLFARESVEFIERNKNRPFQLTVAFNAPHILSIAKLATFIKKSYDSSVAVGHPMQVPKISTARPGEAAKYLAQFSNDTSRADAVATIVALDQAVGKILDKLKASGLDKNTVVFFFGDNGGHPENRSENLPLRDYKWTVYEGGIRTPFFAMYPGVFPAGLNYKQPVSTLDIFKTCTALTGTKNSEPTNLDGVDLTPYLTNKITAPPHDALFFKLNNLGAIRQGKWKLVITDNTQMELYDLSKDVEEQNNLASKQPVLVNDMWSKWKAWNAQISSEKKQEKKDNANRTNSEL